MHFKAVYIQANRDQNFPPAGRALNFKPALVLSRTTERLKVPSEAQELGGAKRRNAEGVEVWGGVL